MRVKTKIKAIDSGISISKGWTSRNKSAPPQGDFTEIKKIRLL